MHALRATFTLSRLVFVLSVVGLASVYGEGRRVRQHDPTLVTSPNTLELVLAETKQVTFDYINNVTGVMNIRLSKNGFVSLSTHQFQLKPDHLTQTINVTGTSLTSRTFVDLTSCSFPDGLQCDVDVRKVFVTTVVMKSYVFKALVQITGWVYFVAWSISFYPQIWLNFERKSVEGLNFDFLYLNIIGFTCYTIYNVLMYFDADVQDLYIEKYPRGVIPVLPNDVVFAIHALAACVITGLQCFVYHRANQRISYICWGWSSSLVVIAAGCWIATLLKALDWLMFINVLSWLKLAVTCSKYIPQAILNFRRKSTVGWSIGNILLDFTGGCMDILQMILQASNTDDWSAFTGNVVKFGLGMVSMVFDMLFMVQHYCLYRHSEGFDLEKPQLESGTGQTFEDS